ncbi:MAG: hypothetical protein JWP59_4791 [Massilia sp.]|nr:hypothetical protein [Massilia sp.]
MKRIKNLEALFLAAAAMATFATYATAEVPAAATTVQAVSSTPAMQVVVIKGQRLTAAQKAAL